MAGLALVSTGRPSSCERLRFSVRRASLLCAIIVATSTAWANDQSSPTDQSRTPGQIVQGTYVDDLNDGVERLAQTTTISGEWVVSPDGLALGPASSGAVTFRLHRLTDEPVSLKLWFYVPDGGHNAVECSNDGRVFRPVAQDVQLVGETVDVWSCDSGTSDVWVRLSANRWGVSRSASADLTLDRLAITASEFELEQPRPSSWPNEKTFDVEIGDAGRALAHSATVSGEWAVSADGLALGPETSGRVTFKIEKEPADPVSLVLWFYRAPDVRTAVECSTDGSEFVAVASDVNLSGEPVDLADCAEGRADVWVRLNAHYWRNSQGASELLVLDRIRLVGPAFTVGQTARSSWPEDDSSPGAFPVHVLWWALSVLAIALGALVALAGARGVAREPRRVAAGCKGVASVRLVLGLCVFGLVVVSLVVASGLLRSSGITTVRGLYDDDLGGIDARLWTVAHVSPSWVALPEGLGLRPGSSGEVLLGVRRQSGDPLRLYLWFYRMAGMQNLVECSSDGERFQTLLENVEVIDEAVDLEACDAATGDLWIRISASYPDDSSAVDDALVLDRLQLAIPTASGYDEFQLLGPPGVTGLPLVEPWSSDPGGGSVGVLGRVDFLVSLTFVLAILIYTARALGARRRHLLQLVFGVATCTVALHLAWPASLGIGATWLGFRWDPLVGFGGLVVLLGCVLAVATGRTAGRIAWATATMLWLLLLGFKVRWAELGGALSRALDQDALTVATIAKQMTYLYDTSFREPLWPWIAKVFLVVVGPTNLSLRLFSMVCSVALLYASYRFVRDYSGRIGLALITLALLVGHDYLVTSSVRGLRVELFMLSVVVLAYGVFVPSLGRRTRIGWLTVGWAAGAATRLTSLGSAAVLGAWVVWRHRLGWPGVAVPLVTTVVLLLPHVLNNARVFGDPLWSVNVHTKWYRNLEFVERRGSGCDGCPTRAEYERDRYGGLALSMSEYVFGMHSPSEVVQGVVVGYGALFVAPGRLLGRYLGTTNVVGYLLYYCGLLMMLATPMRELLLIPLLSLNLLAFAIPLGLDPRLVVHAAPIGVLAMALPVDEGLARLIPSLRRMAERAGLVRGNSTL